MITKEPRLICCNAREIAVCVKIVTLMFCASGYSSVAVSRLWCLGVLYHSPTWLSCHSSALLLKKNNYKTVSHCFLMLHPPSNQLSSHPVKWCLIGGCSWGKLYTIRWAVILRSVTSLTFMTTITLEDWSAPGWWDTEVTLLAARLSHFSSPCHYGHNYRALWLYSACSYLE